MRPSPLWLLAWALLLPPVVDAADRTNDLLRVVSPAAGKAVGAHPFVNIIVGFGFTKDGTPADPTTFRARLGRVDITPLFHPMFDERGNFTGLRAAAGPALIATGRRANRLRLEVRSAAGGKGGRLRDVDRLRFRATDTANQPPTARALSDGDVILPGVPLGFDGSQSHDPDDDDLTYHWDFGDGTTSDEARPEHAFPPQDIDAVVHLTVSDGQASSTVDMTLFAVPPICPGCVPGVLRVEAATNLEFGAVAPGTPMTKSIFVGNTGLAPNSELVVQLGVDNPSFTLSQTHLDLGPLGSAQVDVSFTPTGPGHQGGQLTIVSSSTNQPVARILAHGYSGVAPGTGPLAISSPLFFNTFNAGTQGIFPDGTRFTADNVVHQCVVPGTGPGTGDFCVVDADCADNGGTCPTTSTCLRGDNAGQPCSRPADCPNGFCPSAIFFDPEDMSGDGTGGLYLSSGDGTYTDPNLTRETALSGTLLHLQFDGAGNRTVSQILQRMTEGSTQVAADGVGHVYEAEFHNVEAPGDCFRDSREALVSLRQSGGGDETILMPRIDAAFGIAECDDFEPVDDLQVASDGSTVFAAAGPGLYRIRPTALLITPDWDDFFNLHPDGSVILVTITNKGSTGLLQVYKISPEQALNGAPLLADLTPCVTVPLPNNRAPGTSNGVGLVGFAVDRVSGGSFDATILANFFSGGAITGPASALNPVLGIRGTIAISSPAASNVCTSLGLVNLELLDSLTF